MNQVVKVVGINDLTSRIKLFRLADVNGRKLASFSPGSHILVEIPGETKKQLNPYTLCSSPYNSEFYEIAVLLTEHSRGGSQYLHEIKIGAKVNISFPKNSFALASLAKKHILIAGGIGITPYISMMAYLSRNNLSFELYYGAKSINECAFYETLQQNYSSQTKFYFSELEDLLNPKQILQEQPLGTHLYLCVSHGLRKNFIEEAQTLGYPNSAIHQEIFGAAKANKHKPFTAILARSEQEMTVAANQTLLEALEAANMPINSSCRVGGCGACELKVLAGEVNHLDNYYSPVEKAEQNRILACISRAKNQQLVIDL